LPPTPIALERRTRGQQSGSASDNSSEEISVRNSVTLLIRALTFGLLLTALLFGQNANVSGRIVDSQGGGVPGAKITLIQTATNRTVQTQSNPEGYFRLPPVPPGG